MRKIVIGLGVFLLAATVACAPAAAPTAPGATTTGGNTSAYDSAPNQRNTGPNAGSSAPSTTSSSVATPAKVAQVVRQPVGRQVIYTANLSVQVKSVEDAMLQVQTIADNAGGYMEKLSSNGDAAAKQSTMTIRVPPADFFTALNGIARLGTMKNQNVDSQDVSDQFVDLNARLNAKQIEENHIQALLDKGTNINDILSLETHMTRVRTEIEQMQGQLNVLQRRADYGTINLTLLEPAAVASQAPYASMRVSVGDLSKAVSSLTGKATSSGGVVTSTVLTTSQQSSRADLRLTVKRGEFRNVVTALEAQGKVEEKNLTEGPSVTPSEAELAQADANIAVTLVENPPFNWAAVWDSLDWVLVLMLLAAAAGVAYWIGRSIQGRAVGPSSTPRPPFPPTV